MKKLFVLLLLSLLIPTPIAQAAQNQIIITDKPYRLYDGKLNKNNFETDLAFDGKLGAKVFAPLPKPRVWVIDAALVEEITQFQKEKGSKVAQSWLTQLRRVSAGDGVFATAYSNPDINFAKRISATDLTFYYKYGQNSLAVALGRSVYSAEIGKWNLGRANLSYSNLQTLEYSRKILRNLSTVLPEYELEEARSKISKMMALGLTKDERNSLIQNYSEGNEKFVSKLRVVGGRYRLTTEKEKLPITLVNDFESPITVNLVFEPLNARTFFPKYEPIELNPKSRIQIPVQVENVAAGDSTVLVRFENQRGAQIGSRGVLNISSTVISPLVAWFTTGAAILLFLAAVVQSVRRVRKTRHEK